MSIALKLGASALGAAAQNITAEEVDAIVRRHAATSRSLERLHVALTPA